MTRLVADASAVVDLLAGAPNADAIPAALAPFPEIDVPEHFRVEALAGRPRRPPPHSIRPAE